jgi:GAF domain-containing protein
MTLADVAVSRDRGSRRVYCLLLIACFLVLVPLKSSDRMIGALCAINKKEGLFDQTDVEMLGMIAGTVALSLENARFSDELKKPTGK